jgi:DNA-binding response OmpR family regulator
MNCTVLLVEDNLQVATGIQDRLRMAGVRVVHAATGTEGVRLAAEERPGVIVLDIGLPDIDGFEVCRQIRQLPALGHSRIVFLSAHTQASFRRAAKEAGSDGFLPKTCGSTQVLKEVLALSHSSCADGSVPRPAERNATDQYTPAPAPLGGQPRSQQP